MIRSRVVVQVGLLAVLAATSLVGGCTSCEDELDGSKWESDYEYPGRSGGSFRETLEFTDGTYVWSQGDYVEEGVYTCDGDEIEGTLAGTVSFTAVLDDKGDSLSVTPRGSNGPAEYHLVTD